MAQVIALNEPDPKDWAGWVIYLLDQMEGEAQGQINLGDYGKMLRTLASEIVNHVDSGKW